MSKIAKKHVRVTNHLNGSTIGSFDVIHLRKANMGVDSFPTFKSAYLHCCNIVKDDLSKIEVEVFTQDIIDVIRDTRINLKQLAQVKAERKRRKI